MITADFSNKKVLVSGASGFIGSHLCRVLRDSGASLHGISRKHRKNDDNSIRWWIGDLSDLTWLRHTMQAVKPDFIFHLASHVVGARTLENVMPTFSSNLQSSVHLLTAATEIGCQKLILTGSLEEPDPEDAESVPSSPYAAAKGSASAYARMFHALFSTPVTIARLYMVYGPGQKDLTKLIPYATMSLLREQPPKLTGGTRQIDWIYVEDVVNGLLALAIADNVAGHTIELGSGTLLSIKDIMKILQKIIGSKTKPMFGSIPNRPMEQIRMANVKKTYEMIGWKPEIGIQQGLINTVDWYRTMLPKHFLDPWA